MNVVAQIIDAELKVIQGKRGRVRSQVGWLDFLFRLSEPEDGETWHEDDSLELCDTVNMPRYMRRTRLKALKFRFIRKRSTEKLGGQRYPSYKGKRHCGCR
jgi:hypothetical protein